MALLQDIQNLDENYPPAAGCAPDSYRRSVFEFNGTQSINLSDAITPDRIVLEVYCTGGESNIPGSPAIELNKVVTLDYTYSGAALQNNLFSGFEGVIFSMKLYSSGELISGIRFDESGSDYQRNRAVALGAELQNSIISDDFGGFVPESASGGLSLVAGSLRVTKLSSSSASNIAKIKNLEIGKTYKISVKHATGYEGLKAFIVGTPTNWRYFSNWWVFSNSNGYAEFTFIPDQSEVQILLSSGDEVGGYVDYDNVSIREWSGVMLQNALPDDWMQIEKKRWWDYWREVGNESNILEIAS